ncbi:MULTISPECIES: low temperature requirement protein A [unclassified Bradyrhizobium]|uniref:low temperature requirement protein A n=1 Tax=unclassified Bradyrhizobium TaxID=2631580 RepID=UPI002479AC5C|nr:MULTISPECIES: low temperature requirement protein A [unclassified Bradyrhizobium]WGR74109.1 low temperature requirement protein A [Bradyrhizobium sp. ISRA426]WGR78944.1 low temperature requirement protein A [Bradyrhizobium sp. ISRA430]WGR89348.1 low temperature requirement protein A [Bradyrhizobium sp. ISRA432]
MAAENPRGAMFRVIVPNQHSRVTYAELFFDLVFVFAVTQVSHTLLHHFTPLGAVHVTLLFLAVWWVWVYTTWVTNWLNPELTPVRILLFLMMLGGLVLSTTIPTAFEGRGLWFAIAYASMQVGRTAFWLFATPPHRTPVRHNAIRILVWLSASAIFWILGGFADGETRLWLWIVALTIEYVSPAARFWVPKLGLSSIEAWAVEGGHMAERCAGFIIIALGEAIVVNGATFAELDWTTENILAFVSALVGSVAMWWIYFHKGAEAGSELISKTAESGRLARLAYTYLHLPIVAGIILTAVSDELVLKHPTGHSDIRIIVSTIGGPLVFLVGTILFKHSIRGFLQLSHGIGIVLLLVLSWFAADLSPLWLSIATSVIMIVVAVWESVSLGSTPAEAEEH